MRSGNTMPNFQFIAEYTDGTIYYQHEADLPQHGEGGNSFTDVIQSRVASIENLSLFHLTNGERKYSVNLLNGTFKINGAEFAVEGENFEGELSNVRLVYWIVTTRNFNPGDLLDASVEHRWQLGWQGNDSTGKNHQKIITFA